MSAVGIVDLTTLLATLLALAILWRGWNRALGQASKLLIAGFFVLELFHHLSNVLEWGGISPVLDPLEDYVEIMEPLFFGFFIYVSLMSFEVDEHKRSDSELQKNHGRFPTVLDGLDAHIYVADLETYEILYMNKRMQDDFGDRLIGKLCWKEFREESGPCSLCTNAKLIDEHGNFLDTIIWEGQNPLTGKWYLNNDQAITWVDGRLARLQVALDITERKRTESLIQALNQASLAIHITFLREEIFSVIAEELNKLGFSSVILALDKSQTMLHIAHTNLPAQLLTAAEKLTGLKLETFSLPIEKVDVYREAIGERKTIFIENTADIMRQVLPKPLEKFAGKLTSMLNLSCSIIVPLVAGESVFGLLSVQADNIGVEDSDAVTAFAHQVSAAWRKAELFEDLQAEIVERRKTESALRESHERLRLAGKISYDLIYEWDISTDALTWFGDIDGLLGYKQGEISRDIDAWLSLIHPDDSFILEDAVELHRTSTEPIHYEYRIRQENGTYRQWVDHGLPLLDDNDRPYKWVGVCTDITERKQAEESLKQYAEKLTEMVDERTQELREAQEELVQSERLATLGQLGSGVAHELRNPLGVISNAVYFLKSSLIDADEKTKEYLELISTEVGVSTQIITNLLNLSRKTDPIMETVLLSELITKVLDRQPPTTGVEVSTNLDDDMSVYADPSHIVQVLENIFSNAYQAMPEGGELTIGTRTEYNYALISVTDTGAGIPKEHLDKVFEPLFTTKARGIGLGLTLSKNLLEANGGSISVESVVDKGTTFTIKLQALNNTLSG